MYAPHRTIPHSVKHSTTLTEITEHYRTCFRLLPSFSTYLVTDENRIIMEFITYNEGDRYIHEKKQLLYQILTNNRQSRFSC